MTQQTPEPQYVVLCDENGKAIGQMEKMQAHREGLLHRAFSVVITNSQGQILLQRRARTKYHSGTLWTNTCCGHPRPGEDPAAAALRRLYEEMRLICTLKHVFTFSYRAELDKGMIENEVDDVFMGVCDDIPRPDPAEADGFRYMSPSELLYSLAGYPEQYTVWFRVLIKKMQELGLLPQMP